MALVERSRKWFRWHSGTLSYSAGTDSNHCEAAAWQQLLHRNPPSEKQNVHNWQLMPSGTVEVLPRWCFWTGSPVCQCVTTVTEKGLILFPRRGVHCGPDQRGPAGELPALGEPGETRTYPHPHIISSADGSAVWLPVVEGSDKLHWQTDTSRRSDLVLEYLYSNTGSIFINNSYTCTLKNKILIVHQVWGGK